MSNVNARITHGLLVLVLFALLGVIGMLATDVRGGPLDPPGIPGSTDGVRQPGTPISSIPSTITQPGNYYVTRNLTMAGGGIGILIAANDVTLDLGGFALDGAGIGSDGIRVNGNTTGALVRNGKVLNWGIGAVVVSGTVENIAAHDNVTGIQVSIASLVGCTAFSNTGVGVRASFSTVTDCVSSANGTGFDLDQAALRGCVAESNSTTGIDAELSVVEGCSVVSSGGHGIVASNATIVRNNTVYDSGANGIRLSTGSSSLVIDNIVVSSGGNSAGSGISVEASGNRITGNNVTLSNVTGIGVSGSSNTVDGNSVSNSVGFGFHIQGSKNTVVRNSAVNNGTPVNNYVIDPGNNPGTVIAANSTSDWSNTQ